MGITRLHLGRWSSFLDVCSSDAPRRFHRAIIHQFWPKRWFRATVGSWRNSGQINKNLRKELFGTLPVGISRGFVKKSASISWVEQYAYWTCPFCENSWALARLSSKCFAPLRLPGIDMIIFAALLSSRLSVGSFTLTSFSSSSNVLETNKGKFYR